MNPVRSRPKKMTEPSPVRTSNGVKVLIFVIIMGTVSGGLLVGVNALTSSLIAKNEEIKLKSSVLDVLEIEYERPNLIKIFDENIKVNKKGEYIFYNSPDGAVAFEFKGPGLWGPIYGIISLEKDLKTIRKIKITHQEETPGLGGRIAEQDYLKQFRKKEVLPRLKVDAITGATGTSRAFEKLINENVQKNLSWLKE